MRYNVSLGLLATDAMTELTKAEASDNEQHYRAFLEKSAEFCRSIRRSYAQLQIVPGTLPAPAVSFLNAVKASEQERLSATTKLEAINVLEPLIVTILNQQRIPTEEERLKIAQALYQTSAADPR